MVNKKFYWIKLKTDFFNQDTIDFLLSQKNGCEYIVLYQMLCLKTANNGGKLSTNLGEMIVPYDIDKIVRECKYFDTDTVMVALELFKKLNLIYQEEDKILKITNFDDMVGSECSSAKRVREWRERQKVLQCNMNVTQEIENRDKSLDIEKDNKERIERKFIKPTVEQINEYCKERNNGINATRFFDFYESKNWMIGKNKMKDWKACVRTWEQRETKKAVPEWFDKEITTNEDDQEDEEFKNFINDFRNN